MGDISRLIFLNSAHSAVPNNPHDTFYVLDQIFQGENNNNYVLSFESFQFANLVYPINSNNDKFYFQENNNTSITYTATLSHQNYDGSQIALELATAMTNASGNGYTYLGSFNDQTKKLTITADPGQVWRVNTVHYETGFKITLFFSQSITALNTVRLDGAEFIDIITNISSKNYSSDNKTNILYRIPLNEPFGSIVFFQNTTDDYLYVHNSDIQVLEMRIIDNLGRAFILPDNAPVSITLKIREI